MLTLLWTAGALAFTVAVWKLFSSGENAEDLYVFDPLELKKIFEAISKEVPGSKNDSKKTLALKRIAELEGKLEKKYGIPTQSQWVLNYAYGILCPLKILYASPFEYILIWGTPSGNEGGTGRHRFCTFYDTVLDGQVLYWSERDPLGTATYGPGESWVHVRGDCGGQRIPGHAWVVEYARGFLPTIMPFGLVSTLITLDITSVYRTLKLYAELNLQHFAIGSKIKAMKQSE